jgi:ammonium transporter, Amt family
VTPKPVFAVTDISEALAILFIVLVPFAVAGIALINTGLSRSRSAAHSMLATLCVVGSAVTAYFLMGFAWQGYPGLPSHAITVFGKDWDLLGAGRLFLRGVPLNGSHASLAILLQFMAVSVAALIPLGAGAERWRLRSCCVSTVILAGVTYPLFAHWVWGGGWLSGLGDNYSLGLGFLDAGGSSTIQVVGGLTALSIVWLLGPRRGKFNLEGVPAAVPGHNQVLVLFGCLLALVGWIGLNAAGSLLFIGVGPGTVVLVIANTLLSAGAGVLAAAIITRYRFGKPDASLSANGWISGLVASSAGCAFMSPAAAVLIGLVAGAIVTYTVAWLEAHLGLDDPAGAVSVHAIGGIWGIVAAGLFPRAAAAVISGGGPVPVTSPGGQMLAQIVGVAALLGLILPLTYGLNWLLNRFYPQRIPIEDERHGADLYELGAGAYPDFVTHSDEFSQW